MLEATIVKTVKEIIISTLEVDADDLSMYDNFEDVHGADSLRKIEILAALEREFKIKMDQSELAKMIDLEAVLGILEQYLLVQAK